jgi:hypothetical protein
MFPVKNIALINTIEKIIFIKQKFKMTIFSDLTIINFMRFGKNFMLKKKLNLPSPHYIKQAYKLVWF